MYGNGQDSNTSLWFSFLVAAAPVFLVVSVLFFYLITDAHSLIYGLLVCVMPVVILSGDTNQKVVCGCLRLCDLRCLSCVVIGSSFIFFACASLV